MQREIESAKETRRSGNDGDGESVQPYSSNWLKVIDLQMIK